MNGRPNLLLVEDNTADATLLMDLFEIAGFSGRFTWLKDGEEAWDFLRACQTLELPDFLILDLNLPRIHGLELLEHVRRDQRLHQLPVMVLTTSSNESDRTKSLALSANSFVTKPQDLTQYEELVKHVIEVEIPRYFSVTT